MNLCFGDTSFYLALLIPQDSNHAAAQRLARGLRRTVITSEFVAIEVGNYLSATSARHTFVTFLHSLRADPHTTIISASSDLLARGVELYHRRPDKTWSVTDCTSFVIMEEHNINDALTADHHFEQAGFTVLIS